MPPPPIPRAQTASHLSAQSSAASGSTGFSSKLAGSVEQQTYLVELQQLGTHMCQRWKASEDVQGAWRAVTAQKDRLAEWTTLLTTVSLLGLFPSVMSFIIHHRAKGPPSSSPTPAVLTPQGTYPREPSSSSPPVARQLCLHS